jgi:hypothetical protein
MFYFDGPEWNGVQWIEFGEGCDCPYGFDQITFKAGLPEPGTLALLSLGLAGLAFTRRRKH